ncbi:MAG: ABC transporter ATP-binding protein [Euryarchaeota archaeon]|nr:ABC transporter ATP-binding protein [Euryarchaeota archaeon]
MPAIQTRGLTKRYGRFTAVDRLDLVVEEGEIFGLLGSNGAGKTTTIQMLTTLTRPSGGTARIYGHDIRIKPREVRKHIGAVSDGINLYPDLSLHQNLHFFGRGYGLRGHRLEARVDDVLSRVDLLDWQDEPLGTYSFGMRKRAQIAVALVHEPKVLFMDEATTGIDPQNSIRIRNLVQELAAEGMTIVWTTHMMEEPERLCDRVAIMSRGKVRALGKPYELARMIEKEKTIEIRAQRDANPEQVRFMAGVLRRRGLPVIDGDWRSGAVKLVVAKDFDMGDLMAVTDRFGYIHSINTIGPSLEDVFIHYTTIGSDKGPAEEPKSKEGQAATGTRRGRPSAAARK